MYKSLLQFKSYQTHLLMKLGLDIKRELTKASFRSHLPKSNLFPSLDSESLSYLFYLLKYSMKTIHASRIALLWMHIGHESLLC